MEQLDGLAQEKKNKKDRATRKEEYKLAQMALIKVRQHAQTVTRGGARTLEAGAGQNGKSN